LYNHKETIDKKISLLCEDARDKLCNIDSNARVKKKQIIIDLAKDLEDKIPTGTISTEIVTQLRGQISERFIHECLPEKYKQKSRVEHARKQKKNQAIDKLAAVTPLNPIEEKEKEEKNKQAILVDVDGRASIQDNENRELTKDPENVSINKSLKISAYQQQQQSTQDQEIEEESFQEIYQENHNLNEDEKTNQISTTTSEDEKTSENKDSIDINNNKNIITFEFSMPFGKIRRYVTPLYEMLGEHGLIWFHGRIDKRTTKVIYSNFGRIEQQQQQQYQYKDESKG
jgi:hypothetical protein